MAKPDFYRIELNMIFGGLSFIITAFRLLPDELNTSITSFTLIDK